MDDSDVTSTTVTDSYDQDVTYANQINSTKSGLIIFIFILVAILIIAALVVLLIYNGNVHTIVSGTTILTSSTHCTPLMTSLPDLSSQLCCENFGLLTSNKYLQSLNMTVSLTPTNYLSVCSSYCTQGYSSTLGTCNGNISADIAQFNNCVTATQPVNCSDIANPVAVSNGQYMYGFASGETFCQSLTTCALSF